MSPSYWWILSRFWTKVFKKATGGVVWKKFSVKTCKISQKPPAMGNLFSKVADLGNFQESYPIKHLWTAALWDKFLRYIFFFNLVSMISSVKIIRSLFFTLFTTKMLRKCIAQFDNRSSCWQVFSVKRTFAENYENV